MFVAAAIVTVQLVHFTMTKTISLANHSRVLMLKLHHLREHYRKTLDKQKMEYHQELLTYQSEREKKKQTYKYRVQV